MNRLAEVNSSGCASISIRYHGATNTKPSRLSVAKNNGTGRTRRQVYSYDQEHTTEENITAVVAAWLLRQDSGWRGRWVTASVSTTEWVAVRVPDQQ